MHYLPSWTLDDLPKPTKDVGRAKVDIDVCGYCLLKDAVPMSVVERCRYRLREQAAAEKERGLAFEDGGKDQQWGDFKDHNGRVRPEACRAENGGVNQRVWMLANRFRPS